MVASPTQRLNACMGGGPMLAATKLKVERGVKRLMEKSFTDDSTGQSAPIMSSIYDGTTTSEDTCSIH